MRRGGPLTRSVDETEEVQGQTISLMLPTSSRPTVQHEAAPEPSIGLIAWRELLPLLRVMKAVSLGDSDND